jgi:hypothetical protein
VKVISLGLEILASEITGIPESVCSYKHADVSVLEHSSAGVSEFTRILTAVDAGMVPGKVLHSILPYAIVE